MIDTLLDPKYAFISAYLKGEAIRLVNSDHVNRLSAATGIQDALRAIKGTHIGGYLEGISVKTLSDLDEGLWWYFRDCVEHIKLLKSLPDDMYKMLSVYTVKYDVANIKAALLGIWHHR